MKEETKKLLSKAERAIPAAETLLKEGDIDFAASRIYYAIFYIAEALLNEKDLRFRKHGGVHAAFGEHFVKSGLFDAKFHRWLLDSFDERIQCDYGVDLAITSEDVVKNIQRAREFLEVARRYLKT